LTGQVTVAFSLSSSLQLPLLLDPCTTLRVVGSVPAFNQVQVRRLAGHAPALCALGSFYVRMTRRSA
jgi:hypothetical protein